MHQQYFWLALFVLVVYFLVSWRMYRERVPSWEHLLGMGLSVIIDNYGWTVEYRRFDEPVPLWERIFIRMDVNRIMESAPEVRHRFFKDGKVLPMTFELQAQVAEYNNCRDRAYKKTNGRPWRNPQLASLPAPYDTREVSFSRASMKVSQFAA